MPTFDLTTGSPRFASPPEQALPGTPRTCLAEIPDLIIPGRVHVCCRTLGHPYIPNACTDNYVHNCACGARFTTEAVLPAAPDPFASMIASPTTMTEE